MTNEGKMGVPFAVWAQDFSRHLGALLALPGQLGGGPGPPPGNATRASLAELALCWRSLNLGALDAGAAGRAEARLREVSTWLEGRVAAAAAAVAALTEAHAQSVARFAAEGGGSAAVVSVAALPPDALVDVRFSGWLQPRMCQSVIISKLPPGDPLRSCL